MLDSLGDKVLEGPGGKAPPEVSPVHAGIIPLLDCAPLVVAAEFGFAEKYNLRLEISREQSWASIRDKVTIGHLDCAHMLGPMVIASTLGIGHVRTPLIAPMALGLNGNAITVSNDAAGSPPPASARISTCAWSSSPHLSWSPTWIRA